MIASADNVIRLQGLSQEMTHKICSLLQWPNPDYAKKQEMGYSTWNTPKNIVLWQKKGNELIIPFGMLQYLWQSGIQVAPVAHLMAPQSVFTGEVEGLYPYQQKALEEAIKRKNGVLVAPCGSGKTQIGIAVCARLGMNTLWLTHTTDLLNQSMERAKRYLDIPMGTITGGQVNAGKYLTFATVQTLSKIDLTEFKNYWDVIIVDECHRCVGTPTQVTMFWKVLSALSARYKFGLTATPKRSDGMEQAMFALLGPKVHEIGRDEVRQATTPLHVQGPIKTGWIPNFDKVTKPDGTLDYTSLITDCINNEARNQVVAKAIEHASKSGPVLVLSERIFHLETLSKLCHNSSGILSTVKKGCRHDLIDDLQSGKIQVLFATYAIAKEGLDIPCLRHLIMASPIKNDIAVTQSAGRVMRAFPGKEYGTVWDFEDAMRMLQGWLKKRMKIYANLNK